MKNYSGDLMNFEMAAEMCDVANATVLVNDDVAVENSSFTTGRRGVAGTVIVEKLVGSFAESGANLAQRGSRRWGKSKQGNSLLPSETSPTG